VSTERDMDLEQRATSPPAIRDSDGRQMQKMIHDVRRRHRFGLNHPEPWTSLQRQPLPSRHPGPHGKRPWRRERCHSTDLGGGGRSGRWCEYGPILHRTPGSDSATANGPSMRSRSFLPSSVGSEAGTCGVEVLGVGLVHGEGVRAE